jgi:transaldolase
MSNALRDIRGLGQSVWLDNLSRDLLRGGGLASLIADDGVSGVTSNPSIFQKAISGGKHYGDDLGRLRNAEPDVERRLEGLIVPDIQDACDLLRSVFEATDGDDGYVSLEVSPRLAHEEAATVAAAHRLRGLVDRPNLLIKVPGTPAGVRAFERLISEGVSVNVTLLFSLQQTVRILEAYIRGLKKWVDGGGNPKAIKAVASLFLSRVDTLVDDRLKQVGTPEALARRGEAAVAVAKLAYQRYREIFHGEMFADLARQGCRPQYPLWASTSTKNPDYHDLKYVEPLIGPETINTMPDATVAAFRDHGRAEPTVSDHVGEAQETLLALERLGIDMHGVGEVLQSQGVDLFAQAYDGLLQVIR